MYMPDETRQKIVDWAADQLECKTWEDMTPFERNLSERIIAGVEGREPAIFKNHE